MSRKIQSVAIVLGVILFGTTQANLINEFEPNPVGGDPATQTVELSGTPGDSFSGWILSVDTDFSPGQTVDRATMVSGTYDANGLLTASIDDLENPSLTLLLVDAFTGATGDVLDDASDLAGLGIGTVYDAINTPDSPGDEANSIAGALGGTDFTYTGDEPKLMFRDGTTGDWYAVNDQNMVPESVFDVSGNQVANVSFDMDPEVSTFGSVNPSFVPEPGGLGLIAFAVFGLMIRRR